MNLFLNTLVLFFALIHLQSNAADAIPLRNQLGDTVVDDADFLVTNEDFTSPNEKSPFLFREPITRFSEGTIGQQRILVSVGTFRALIDFSWADFEYLFMLDWDKRAVNFNRRLIHAIEQIMDTHSGVAEQMAAFNTKYGFKLSGLNSDKDHPYFWQNERGWERITTAIKEDRIRIVQAQLGAWSTPEKKKFTAVFAKTFKNAAILIDISNLAPQYAHLENILNHLVLLTGQFEHFILFTSPFENVIDAHNVGIENYNQFLRKQFPTFEGLSASILEKPEFSNDNWSYGVIQ